MKGITAGRQQQQGCEMASSSKSSFGPLGLWMYWTEAEESIEGRDSVTGYSRSLEISYKPSSIPGARYFLTFVELARTRHERYKGETA